MRIGEAIRCGSVVVVLALVFAFYVKICLYLADRYSFSTVGNPEHALIATGVVFFCGILVFLGRRWLNVQETEEK